MSDPLAPVFAAPTYDGYTVEVYRYLFNYRLMVVGDNYEVLEEY